MSPNILGDNYPNTRGYDSELQNGGHLQYFENHRKNDYFEVINSLKAIGAEKQSSLLLKTSVIFLGKKRKPIKSVQSYIKKTENDEYSKFDSEYYHIKPDVNFYLEEYLKNNLNEFIELK